MRAAAVSFAAVLFAKLWEEAKLAEFLLVASLRTLAIALAFGLFRHLVHGGLEWAVQGPAARGVSVVRSNAATPISRLGLLFDFVIAAALLGILLVVWQVYGSPAEAISGLLSVRVTIG